MRVKREKEESSPRFDEVVTLVQSAQFHGDQERGRLARVFPGFARAGEPPALQLF
jgi:hypothetical protein